MSVTRRDFIKALGALAGVAVASQFDNQLGAVARALSGPQEWVLSIDEDGLERLCRERTRIGPSKVEGKNFVVECSLDVSENDIWALATLTDPDGNEWRTADGATWVCGEGMMSL